MARAELDIDIKANSAPAKKGVKEVKKETVNAIEEIQAKNKEALKGFLGVFAPVAIAINAVMMLMASISNAIKEYFSAGQAFVDWGEKANVSAQSVAYLKAQADSAGVSAQEFERAMDDLGAGRVTIEQLRKEWQGLGNDIKTASNAQNNFRELARQKNFDLFGEGWTSFWGGMAEQGAEMIGMGGAQVAKMEQMAYAGATYEEALKEARNARRGWHMPVSDDRLKEAFYTAKVNKSNDEFATRQRNMEYTAKQLYKADLSATDREAIFKSETGRSLSNDAILEMAKKLLSREEKLAERISESVEATKKEEEREKKHKEEQEKFNDELDKIGTGLKESFTAGGGLIGGVNYSLKYNDISMEQLAVMRQQLQAEIDAQQALKSIDKTLKGDE